MDFTNMTVDQLMERRSAIAVELDKDDADLDALEAEVRVYFRRFRKDGYPYCYSP